jgi:hypothetical protein
MCIEMQLINLEIGLQLLVVIQAVKSLKELVRFNQDGTLQIMTSKGQLSRPLTPLNILQTLDDIMSGYSQ